MRYSSRNKQIIISLGVFPYIAQSKFLIFYHTQMQKPYKISSRESELWIFLAHRLAIILKHDCEMNEWYLETHTTAWSIEKHRKSSYSWCGLGRRKEWTLLNSNWFHHCNCFLSIIYRVILIKWNIQSRFLLHFSRYKHGLLTKIMWM